MTQKITPTLWLCGFTVAFGYSFSYGYNTAKLNTPIHIFEEFYNKTYSDRGTQFTESSWKLLWAVTISIYVAMGAVGSFMSGWFAEKFGRRNGQIINTLFAVIGGLLESLSKPLKLPELLIVGRSVTGLHVGIAMSLGSMYLLEVSPKNSRGVLGSLHQLGVTTGILIAQILGLDYALGTDTMWPLLCGITGMPSIIAAVILFFFCPETPRYLYLTKGDEKASRKAMEFLHPNQESIETEIADMKAEQEAAIMLASQPELQQQSFKMKHLLFRREQRMALIISISLMVCQMWSGINAIFAYSHTILMSAGVKEDEAQFAIVATGVINILVTMSSIVLIERTGRRNLVVWPTLLMCASMGALVVTIHIQESAPWCSYISVCLLLTYIVGFGLGLGPCPTIIPLEIFHQDSRPSAISITNAVHWSSNFLVQLTYGFIKMACGEYLFFIYISISLASLGVVAMFLPETANRDINDIVSDLRRGWRWKPFTQKSQTQLLEDEKHLPLTNGLITEAEKPRIIERRKSAFV